MEIYQFYFLLYFYCTRSYETVCRISRFSTTIQTFPQWCCESKNRITILSAMEYHNSETKDDRNIFTSGERRNNVAINYVWPTWITRRSRKAGFIKEKERLLNPVSNSLFIPTWLFSFITCSQTKRPLQKQS